MPYRKSSRSVDLEALRRVPEYVTPDVVVPPGLASIPARRTCDEQPTALQPQPDGRGPGGHLPKHRPHSVG